MRNCDQRGLLGLRCGFARRHQHRWMRRLRSHGRRFGQWSRQQWWLRIVRFGSADDGSYASRSYTSHGTHATE